MNQEEFDRGCFSAGWTDEVQHNLSPKQRKDLVTLLLELEDIKNDFARISEHKTRLDNLWKFYSGEMVTE